MQKSTIFNNIIEAMKELTCKIDPANLTPQQKVTIFKTIFKNLLKHIIVKGHVDFLTLRSTVDEETAVILKHLWQHPILQNELKGSDRFRYQDSIK